MRPTPVSVMLGGSLASSVVATAAAGQTLLAEVFVGMLGPLVVAVFTWELAERTYRRHPERLTGVMVTAFAGKMVFFGAYVAAALLGLSLRPIPFVLSFTVYFIGLHVVEAVCLRRLFVEAAPR